MQNEVDFNQAIAAHYPEPVSIAIARDLEGKDNPITLGWSMRTSIDPALFAISVGLERYSCEVIRHAREFVLALPSVGMERETMFFGEQSGRHIDKLAMMSTRLSHASRVDSVLLDDAAANFECVLESEHETGDHVIFVGRVVCSHVHRDAAARRLYSLNREHKLGPARD
jgi:flavin reductase (DIM6/NTAB) family NADH-FMN oxidoreductase RutF